MDVHRSQHHSHYSQLRPQSQFTWEKLWEKSDRDWGLAMTLLGDPLNVKRLLLAGDEAEGNARLRGGGAGYVPWRPGNKGSRGAMSGGGRGRNDLTGGTTTGFSGTGIGLGSGGALETAVARERGGARTGGSPSAGAERVALVELLELPALPVGLLGALMVGFCEGLKHIHRPKFSTLLSTVRVQHSSKRTVREMQGLR